MICFLCSCTGTDDFSVEKNARLYSSGVIVDIDSNPIEIIIVSINDDGRSLGSSKTNAEGFYEFVSLKSNADVFDVVVNFNLSNDLNGYIFRSYDLEVNDLSLGTVTLKGTANLDFKILKSSTIKDDLTYSISYNEISENSYCVETLTGIDPLQSTIPLPSCENPITMEDQITTNGTASASRIISSIKGEKVVFSYRLGNSDVVRVLTPLTNTQNSYEFEY